MMPVRRNNQNWLPGIFNDIFSDDWMMPRVNVNANAPAINVIENAKDYKIEVAAPGMTKSDFKVNLDEDNNLVISMEKKFENNNGQNKGQQNAEQAQNQKSCGSKESHYLRREFSYSKFQQIMSLPDDIVKDKISAKVENGVLNIVLPKKEPEKQHVERKSISIE